MSRLLIAFSLFLSLQTALLPAGLCGCWLMVDVAEHHPHPDGHSEQPHSHEYLFDLFNAGTPATATLNVLPADQLVELLNANPLWHQVTDVLAEPSAWSSPPLSPPPRF
jgi:hypothetical protein